MDAFVMEIAGLAVQVQPLFLSTKEYCKAYLTKKKPAFFVAVTPQDLLHEQQLLEQEAVEENLRIRKFTDPFLERSVIQRKIAEKLVEQDVLLFHGSTVGVDGSAYLFTAACGTGKSTHTRFWREQFPDRAVMVNDDKPFLRISDQGVWAYGSPWGGKHGLSSNIRLPLKGICLLKRGQENRIRFAEAEQILSMLRHQACQPEDLSTQDRVLRLVEKLASIVPLWEMECTKDPEAALIAYHAMRG